LCPRGPIGNPLVHAIIWDLPGSDASLPADTLPDKRCAANDALAATWLPPESQPGRAELLDKIKGHVIAKGLLIGTYERK
jgi:phosphatidylethanolamine-binding protein (PEBP) family uncharacterized protein